jgi:hypothetical protein
MVASLDLPHRFGSRLAYNEETKPRFVHEARAASALGYPNSEGWL